MYAHNHNSLLHCMRSWFAMRKIQIFSPGCLFYNTFSYTDHNPLCTVYIFAPQCQKLRIVLGMRVYIYLFFVIDADADVGDDGNGRNTRTQNRKSLKVETERGRGRATCANKKRIISAITKQAYDREREMLCELKLPLPWILFSMQTNLIEFRRHNRLWAVLGDQR